MTTDKWRGGSVPSNGGQSGAINAVVGSSCVDEGRDPPIVGSTPDALGVPAHVTRAARHGSSGEKAVLACAGLTKRFGRERLALDGVTFQVSAGEVYGLAGPNGAGKTTLIGVLSGLLRPDSGTTAVLGRPARRALAEVGVVFQRPALYPWLTVRHNIDVLSTRPGIAQRYLDDLGLDRSILIQKGGALSIGQQHRVSLAIGLAKEARLYLLDEPSAALDLDAATALRTILSKLTTSGAAIVLASHEWPFLGEMCNRVGVLMAGRLHQELTAAPRDSAAGTSYRLTTDRMLDEALPASLPGVIEWRPVPNDGARHDTTTTTVVRIEPASDPNVVLSALVGCGVTVHGWMQEPQGNVWQRQYRALLNAETNR